MNVIVQSKTMVVTEALRGAATRLAKKFSRRRQKINTINVFIETVAKKKNDMTSATAKFAVDLPGKNVVVQERAKDAYVALSEAAHAVMRQLGKTKERRITRRYKLAGVRA